MDNQDYSNTSIQDDRRIHQADIPPGTIKNRHMGEGVSLLRINNLDYALPTTTPTIGQFLYFTGSALGFQTYTYTPPTVPIAKVYNSTSPSLTGNIDTLLGWDTSEVNTNTMWVGTDNSKLTINTAGKYLITGHINFYNNNNATGRRYAFIRKNGNLVQFGESAPTSTAGVVTVEINTILDLALADYVEICANQSSGGSMQVMGADLNRSYFQAFRIG